MEVEQFVTNVFVPYPYFNLQLSFDSFHAFDLLLDDPGQATLNWLIILNHAFLGLSHHVKAHRHLCWGKIVIVFWSFLISTLLKCADDQISSSFWIALAAVLMLLDGTLPTSA